MNWLSRNWLGVIVSIALLIVAFSIFYYFVLFLPEEHRLRLELEREKQATEEQHRKEEQAQKKENLRLLDSCLLAADTRLLDKWNAKCDSLKKGTGCALLTYLANDIEARWKDERESCFKRYPQ